MRKAHSRAVNELHLGVRPGDHPGDRNRIGDPSAGGTYLVRTDGSHVIVGW
jgi:hypothetical protein